MKRRKKRFVLPLCLLLLLSLCAPAYAAADAPFADIHGHWAECQMTWAQEAGILTGTSSTTLSPDDTATRAMAVTVLYRYAGSPAVEGTSGFADVPADAYYADGVAWCVQAGLITGKTETAFRPGDPMTREEFAATLYRLLVDATACRNRWGKTMSPPWRILPMPSRSAPLPKTPWPGRWETFSCPVSARRETRGSYCRKAPSPGAK